MSSSRLLNNRSPSDLQLRKLQRQRDIEAHQQAPAAVVPTDGQSLRPNPWQHASFFSRLTFAWLDRLVYVGSQRALTSSDFYELSPMSQASCLAQRITTEWERERPKPRPNIRWVLMRVFGPTYVLNIVNGLLSSGFRIAQALLLRYIVREFVDPNGSDVAIYCMAMGFTLSSICQSLANQHFINNNTLFGVTARVGFISAIYKKLTRLSVSSISSTGQVVNLVSNDVQRLEDAGTYSAFLVTSIVECGVVFGLVWQAIGFPVVFGFAALFIFMMPIQAFFARKFGEIRKKTVGVRDERIRNLSDIFTGIQVLKLYAWEIPFQQRIMDMRKHETTNLTHASYMKTINDAFFAASAQLMSLATFIPYVALGNVMAASAVFSTIAFYNIVRLSATNFIPKAIEALSESNISLKRIQDFMMLPEMDPAANGNLRDRRPGLGDMAVIFTDATYRWPVVRRQRATPHLTKASGAKSSHALIFNRSSTTTQLNPIPRTPVPLKPEMTEVDIPQRDTLRGIKFNARMGELIAVVGPVGSGKSSLAMSILGEIPRISGSVEISGRIGYVAQTPWVLSGTVRENILFGQPMDQTRYERVIDACALRADLAQFSAGDETPIGERGTTLSGGQRARLGLARAIYLNAEVYVLDDPLSAVDARVSRILFEQAIKDLLKDKCVLLITHQLQYARYCDRVLVLDDGAMSAFAPYDEVIALDDTQVPYVKVLREYQEAKGGGVDEAVEAVKVTQGDQITTAAANAPSHAAVLKPQTTTNKLLGDQTAKGNTSANVGVQKEDALGSIVTTGTYIEYFRNGGGVLGAWVLLLLLIVIATPVASGTASDWFLLYWTQHPFGDHQVYSGIYGGLVGLCFLLNLARGFIFYTVTLRASRKIFETMLDSILRVPQQFFVANPVGRILNRFAKDLGLVDELLPMTMLDTIYFSCFILAIFGIVGYVAPYVLIAIGPLAVAFYFLRRYFLSASREIKRLEALSRSPIYSHVSASLEGLVTIRAFNLETQFVQQLYGYQDENTRIYSTFINCSRWLAFRIDMITVIFLTLTVFIGAGTRHSLNPGSIGLALAYALQLAGLFQWCTRQSTEVENQMVSTGRLLAYTKLDQEAPRITDVRPPPDWPLHGEIVFDRMTLMYPGTETPVLHELSLTVRAGEKVGVVGRTGAGKSSMMLSLFRIVEPKPKGSVLIDGVNCSELGLHDVRSKLSIIPQEPFLFKGTVRFNLDPNNEYSDEALWHALTSVELKSTVERLDGKLEASVQENGSNFSAGERQLFCLARAILRNSRIIVMDEPTANVDAGTDFLIQKSVRHQFSTSTVITIAHRLHTIIDYDRVLVLDSGRMVEFDAPHVLLQDVTSFFSRLVDQTGPTTSAQLRHTAAIAYSCDTTIEEPIPPTTIAIQS